MDAVALIDLLIKGSPVVLTVFLVGFLFEWVVPGRAHRSLKEDCKRKDDKINELTTELLKAVRVTGQAVTKARGSDGSGGGKGAGGAG